MFLMKVCCDVSKLPPCAFGRNSGQPGCWVHVQRWYQDRKPGFGTRSTEEFISVTRLNVGSPASEASVKFVSAFGVGGGVLCVSNVKSGRGRGPVRGGPWLVRRGEVDVKPSGSPDICLYMMSSEEIKTLSVQSSEKKTQEHSKLFNSSILRVGYQHIWFFWKLTSCLVRQNFFMTIRNVCTELQRPNRNWSNFKIRFKKC